MFDAYKRFFRFAGEQKGTWYKGMAFELLRSIFEALQFAALLIVLRALVEQNMTGATPWMAFGIMAVSVAGAALCWYLAHNSEGHADYRMCAEKAHPYRRTNEVYAYGLLQRPEPGQPHRSGHLHHGGLGEHVLCGNCPDGGGHDPDHHLLFGGPVL